MLYKVEKQLNGNFTVVEIVDNNGIDKHLLIMKNGFVISFKTKKEAELYKQQKQGIKK